jgi:hypothetical protein
METIIGRYHSNNYSLIAVRIDYYDFNTDEMKLKGDGYNPIEILSILSDEKIKTKFSDLIVSHINTDSNLIQIMIKDIDLTSNPFSVFVSSRYVYFPRTMMDIKDDLLRDAIEAINSVR